MALIHCPECQHEVSDTIKACPHCGYSFKAEEPTKVEVTSVNLKSKNPKKLVMIALMALSLVLIGVVVLSSISKNKEKVEAETMQKIREHYIDGLELLLDTSILAASLSEEAIILTANVWRDTIYEEYSDDTYLYTVQPGGLKGETLLSGYSFREDFNDSISYLYEDVNFKINLRKTDEYMGVIDTLMKNLKTPPEGLDSCYATAQNLYVATQGLADLAQNPQGNLESFTSSKKEKMDKFLEAYKLLETQIPNSES